MKKLLQFVAYGLIFALSVFYVLGRTGQSVTALSKEEVVRSMVLSPEEVIVYDKLAEGCYYKKVNCTELGQGEMKLNFIKKKGDINGRIQLNYMNVDTACNTTYYVKLRLEDGGRVSLIRQRGMSRRQMSCYPSCIYYAHLPVTPFFLKDTIMDFPGQQQTMSTLIPDWELKDCK